MVQQMTTNAQILDTSLFDSRIQNNRFTSFSDEGRRVEEHIKQIQNEERLISAEVAYNQAIEKLHQTILEFMDDGLEMNAESVEIACEFLKKLSHQPHLLNDVSISADPDGKTVLRWKSKTSGVFSMSIGINREIYYASTLQGEDTHGREYFDDEIPSTIREILMKIQ
jgi:hypothetical protein